MKAEVCPDRFSGKRVFIIGGGPSIRGLDLEHDLHDKIVIGVNDAYNMSCTDICCFGDTSWYKMHAENLKNWDGEVWSNNTNTLGIDRVKNLRKSSSKLSTDPDKCAWFGNSGYLAINFALLGHPDEIVLLGYDMDMIENRANWHDDNRSHPHMGTYDSFLGHETNISGQIKHLYPDVSIVNANPVSRLSVFEKVNPEDFGINIPENHIYRSGS